MTVSERASGAVIILDVDGGLTVGDPAERLRDEVLNLLQHGRKHILINMAGVSYMDSVGLGELVQGYASASRQGGSLKLLNTTHRLRDLLVLTKLATVFEIFEDEQQALTSFGLPV